jgi:two-component sensor histidine kinase
LCQDQQTRISEELAVFFIMHACHPNLWVHKTGLIWILLTLIFQGFSQDKQAWTSAIENAPHDSVRLRLYFQLSDQYSGRPRLSKFFALEAQQYLDATESPVLKIKVIQQAANRFWENGEYEKSIAFQNRALEIAKKNEMHYWIGSAFHSIGLNYYYTADYDSALEYYGKAIAEYERAGDSVHISRLENHTAQVLDQMGDYIGATQHLLRSMEMQQRIPGFNNITYDFTSTTRLNDTLMLRSKAEKSIADLAHERQGTDSFKIAQALRNVAQDHTNIGEYQKSLQYLRESVFYYEASGFTPFWLDFGFIYLKTKKYDSAFYYGNRWLTAQLEFGNRNSIAAGYAFKGLVYLRMNNFDSAISNYTKTLALNEEMGNRIWMTENKLSIARILIKKEEYHKSLKFAQDALVLAQKIKSISKQADCYLLLTEIYSNLNLHQQALISHEQFYQLDKQIAKGEAHQAVARLGLQYTINKREKEVKDLLQKNLLSESQIKTRNLQIVLAGIVIIIIASGGWFYFRSYKNKKRTADLLSSQNAIIESKNVTLEKQNQEMEILISEIHHRVKNNLQIISSLINLKAIKASPETSEVLYQLNGRIYSMGLIHERLYQKNEFQSIGLDTYLAELGRYILDSFEEKGKGVRFNVNCETSQVDVDLALTCGLIVNELLTNSLKYAFSSEQEYREVRMELKSSLDEFVLVVADNGNRESIFPENINKTFGLRFVDQLVKSKLKGNWLYEIKNGFYVFIRFPKFES